MKYVEFLICVALASFLGGLIYATQGSFPKHQQEEEPKNLEEKINPFRHSSSDSDSLTVRRHVAHELLDEGISPSKIELKPCSETNTMPCEESPRDLVREKLESHPQSEGLFYNGEKVTCLYRGVYSWDNGDEFMKTAGVQCKVVEASEEFADFAPGYQQIKVNCSEGLKKMWGSRGTGMVKGHPMNYVKRWYTSDDCYHFSS
jgi:hypothetical protein